MQNPKILWNYVIPQLFPGTIAILAILSMPVNSLMALNQPLAQGSPNKPNTISATSSALKVAKQQNATLVEYSIITTSEKSCKSSDHNTNHGDVDKSLGGFW
jgi:hypothetical protein